MRLIKKEKEPKKLEQYRNNGGTFADFSQSKGKKQLKEQLLYEQFNLCAYCTQSISFDSMKVEHWYPQSNPKNKSHNPELDYKNLFAVCLGCYGKERHCDTKKDDVLISINPTNISHINQIYFKNGAISSRNNQHDSDISKVLNLNINPLVKQRKKRLTDFKLQVSKKYKGKRANYQKELRNWKDKNIPHHMVVVRYLESKV